MINEKIRKASFRKPKEEVCGFIILKDDKFDILEVENMAEDKESEFYISAKSFLYARENNQLVAVFHSHPNGTEESSQYDKNCSEATCIPFVIFSTQTRKFSVYVPEFLDVDEEIIKKLKDQL